tara:strand:+ start:278 stop:586 length:309 start_codon:yes stop_codon:yes gene_type:complete
MIQKERYKNKYIRQIFEERLKEENFGVNVHCREDGTYLTIPPATIYNLHESNENVDKIEDEIVEKLVKKVNKVGKTLQLDSKLDYSLHGDNIQIKIDVTNVR